MIRGQAFSAIIVTTIHREVIHYHQLDAELLGIPLFFFIRWYSMVLFSYITHIT